MSAPRIVARRAAAVALTGALLTLVGFVFAATTLFVLALALLAIGVASPLWVWAAARSAHVERVMEAERVTEGHPIDAGIEVTRGRLRLPGAEVIDPLTATRLSLAGARSPLRWERRAHVRVTTHFARRGLHTLASPTLLASDPLELATVHVRSATAGRQILVLPRTEPVRWLRSGRGRRLSLADGRSPADAMAAVDLDGLRPYRPGTSASRIHWPAVARGAGLIERRLQADGDTRPLVVLDARLTAPPDPGLLDDAVRAAASLALELAREGGCGLLLPGEQRAAVIDRGLVGWPAAHARLALVAGPYLRPPALGPSAGRLGPLVYVAASPVNRLTGLLAGAGRGLTVLVVPERTLIDGRPPLVRGPVQAMLEVSGCRGFVLGTGRRSDRARRPATERSPA
ncbi:MAG: DUF58 domain-containing protein [Solirubrobacteraceae bacterium]|jgi:uncharacterized protein (DUF58 family)